MLCKYNDLKRFIHRLGSYTKEGVTSSEYLPFQVMNVVREPYRVGAVRPNPNTGFESPENISLAGMVAVHKSDRLNTYGERKYRLE